MAKRLKGHKAGWILKHGDWCAMSPFLLDDKRTRKKLQSQFKARIGTRKFNRKLDQVSRQLFADTQEA